VKASNTVRTRYAQRVTASPTPKASNPPSRGRADAPAGIPTYIRNPTAEPQGLECREWLLTNGLGGFAMGTVRGTPTRRYHGLLIASLAPPVQREMLLHSLVEVARLDPGGPGERSFDLASFRFRDGVRHPRGDELAKEFTKGASCRWIYRVGDAEIIKTVHLFRGINAVSIRYTIRAGASPVRLSLRPLAAMRDSHGFLSSRDAAAFRIDSGPRSACVRRVWDGGERVLELELDTGGFRRDPQWWYGFEYEHELDRQYDAHEDLFSPGEFAVDAPAGSETTAELTAWIGNKPRVTVADDEKAQERRIASQVEAALHGAEVSAADRETVVRLVAAADDFVVQRGDGSKGPPGVSIIAGYPWFSDWGRDSMISLPGLLLTTARFEDALKVLQTFAGARRNGLVPNLFNDWTGEAEYNTVDGSMWFLHAACEYLRLSGDRAGFDGVLKQACLDIIEAYRKGTDYGIHMDPADGLIAAGDASSQLTWMDAKRDGVVFTPRHGKPVEINALWHHGLLSVAGAIQGADPERAAALRLLAKRAGESFRASFWNPSLSCLYDVLLPREGGGWEPDARIRPNQIFAVSLAYSPLTPEQQRSVLKKVKDTLLTPVGLRTLDAADPGYKARYRGAMRDRDAAYHNGTVWPWLLGPYAEAVLRVGGFSAAAKAESVAALRPLVAELQRQALGQLAEVYDADDTAALRRGPGGCPAQAWSVAEPLRAFLLAIKAGS